MTRNALVTALAAVSLVGCATARVPGALTPDPIELARLPLTGERVKPEPAPRPAAVPAPPDEPMTSSLLRARLVAFVLEAEAKRSEVEPGSAIPDSELAAWERIQVDVDRFLAQPAGDGEAEDVQIARGSLRAALDRDGQAYGGVPPGLVRSVEERLAGLDARMGPPPGPRFQWPLDELRVTSRFGRRFHPIAHRDKMHSGIDLAAERNQPVMAAGAGIVVRAGWMHGYGYEVTIDHGNGRVTRYSHLARTLVLEGTQVVKGMPLGLAGRTGTATGVHLHFEYWKDDVARDPLREFARLVGDDGRKPVVLTHPPKRPKTAAARKPEGPGA
ncbi:MAG TPA: M23 family metallopeptidase [Myxococcaceae bacterium]|nr:M23 family metallopeptidase [Myxococcaceae bacterium]